MWRRLDVSCVFVPLQRWFLPWWRHQMETFSALLAICAGNSPVPGEFPAQRPVTRSFAIFFDLRLNKRLSKQSWGWWFETPSRPLWRHRNVYPNLAKEMCVLTSEHYWPCYELWRRLDVSCVFMSLQRWFLQTGPPSVEEVSFGYLKVLLKNNQTSKEWMRLFLIYILEANHNFIGVCPCIE